MKDRWKAVVPIAATYFFFLLFAQFAFLEGLLERGLAEGSLKPVMMCMGLGGLLGSFLAPGWVRKFGGQLVLRVALVGCAVLAMTALRDGGVVSGGVIALLVGLALGTGTVTLAGCLPDWVSGSGTGQGDGSRIRSPGSGGLVIGIGTGLAYGLCNVPAVFEAGWLVQSGLAAAAAVVGAVGVPAGTIRKKPGAGIEKQSVAGIWTVLAVLFGLVWLDSAAFFIIQHTAELKKDTWGSGLLWRNAGVHLAVAVMSGWLLDRGWLWRVLFAALAILSAAALMVNHGRLAREAGALYPAGVSLYSVALVAVPGFLSGASSRGEALRRAAWIFAVAGWMGSAMGVGMGENLHRVPGWFVMLVWGLVIAGWLVKRGGVTRGSWSVVPLAGGLLGAGWLVSAVLGRRPESTDAVARGREVYISEGCVHCHSRYVRSDRVEVQWWGPVEAAQQAVSEAPVLIGNRRQGPDLLQVGLRRSAGWLKVHFQEPQILNPGTAMPDYGHLFAGDGRGEDLVAFLTAVEPESWTERLRAVMTWEPQDGAVRDNGAGRMLFERHCVSCHGPSGRGDGVLAGRLLKAPANLVDGPFVFTTGEGRERWLRTARVVKFGVPGSDMPGHELLDDGEVSVLADWVLEMRNENGN